MVNPSDQPAIAAQVRTGQIIVGSLVMGVFTFLAIVLALGGQKKGPAANPTLTYFVLPPMALSCVVAALIVPKLIAASARKGIMRGTWPALTSKEGVNPTDAVKLAGVYFTQMIVGAALVEGAAFFATICYLVEHNDVALGVAVVLLLGLATFVPTVPRVEAWIDGQLEQMEQDRQMIT
jgi:hypothetical protein